MGGNSSRVLILLIVWARVPEVVSCTFGTFFVFIELHHISIGITSLAFMVIRYINNKVMVCLSITILKWRLLEMVYIKYFENQHFLQTLQKNNL